MISSATKELYEAHAGSQKDFEAAQDNYSKAKAEIERARQKARLFRGGGADAVTQEFVLRAPIEGEVIARNVNPGAEVQGQYSGGTAAELYTVGELDRVWVIADVFEMDLARLKKGANVTIRVVAYPDRGVHRRRRLDLRPARSDVADGARALRGGEPRARAQARDVRHRHHRRAGRAGAGGAASPRSCASPIRRSSSSSRGGRPTGGGASSGVWSRPATTRGPPSPHRPRADGGRARGDLGRHPAVGDAVSGEDR